MRVQDDVALFAARALGMPAAARRRAVHTLMQLIQQQGPELGTDGT